MWCKRWRTMPRELAPRQATSNRRRRCWPSRQPQHRLRQQPELPGFRPSQAPARPGFRPSQAPARPLLLPVSAHPPRQRHVAVPATENPEPTIVAPGHMPENPAASSGHQACGPLHRIRPKVSCGPSRGGGSESGGRSWSPSGCGNRDGPCARGSKAGKCVSSRSPGPFLQAPSGAARITAPAKYSRAGRIP